MSDDQFTQLKALITAHAELSVTNSKDIADLKELAKANSKDIVQLKELIMANSRELVETRTQINKRLDGVMTTEQAENILQGQADFAKQWADHQEDHGFTNLKLKRHDKQLEQLATKADVQLVT